MSTDSSREEIPRVSFDSLVAWQRVKDSYRSHAMENLHNRARMRGLKCADQVVVDEMNDVRFSAYSTGCTCLLRFVDLGFYTGDG